MSKVSCRYGPETCVNFAEPLCVIRVRGSPDTCLEFVCSFRTAECLLVYSSTLEASALPKTPQIHAHVPDPAPRSARSFSPPRELNAIVEALDGWSERPNGNAPMRGSHVNNGKNLKGSLPLPLPRGSPCPCTLQVWTQSRTRCLITASTRYLPPLVRSLASAGPQLPAAQPMPVPPALGLACRAAVPHPAAPAACKRLERQLAGPLKVDASGVEAPQGLPPGQGRGMPL